MSNYQYTTGQRIGEPESPTLEYLFLYNPPS
jgi:hypothetical protein